jgi:hypothetical protein
MATTYYNDIQKLYVAYFNRPADPAGLAYWETIVEGAKGSTTAVSAAFAASAEYKAAYAGMSNADIVNAVYMNLFGRAAEDAGKAYWAGLLDAKKITIDSVVTQIAAGAQGTDMVAYNDKVTAAGTFTANIDTDAEKTGYSGDAANKVAKAFLTGITDNISLTAATTPAALNASIAATVAAGTPFTVAGALAQVNAAQAIVDAFVKATVTTDVNGDGSKNATDITAAQTKAVAKVAADLTGGASGASGSLFVTTSQTVRDALVSAQQATNAAALTTAQATLAADNAAIAKVAGLTDAVAILAAAQSAQKSAIAAEITTHADIIAKEASFGTVNGGAFVDNGTAMTFTPTGGSTVTLVDISAGKASLHSGVDATKYTGLTDLINSYNAEQTALSNISKAAVNVSNAQLVENMLDISSSTTTVGTTGLTEKALVAAIAAQINATTADTVADGAAPTLAQIQTELAVLKAADTSTSTTYESFKALVDAESVSVDSVGATAALASANAALTAANTALTNANTALTTATTASTNANTALAAVETAFEGGSDVTVSGANLVFTPTGGSVTTLATIDATTHHAALATGVTETTNPGVTDLIAKYNVSVDAAAAVTAAQATVTADQAIVTADQTAVTNATNALATTVALNPLTSQQAADAAVVTADNAAISTLAKDVAALATANANAATLAGDQASVTAYNKVLTDKGYVVTTLDTAHSGALTQFATANSDVYIVKGNSATIAAFGLQGSDSLFVGSSYSLVNGAIGAKGVVGSDAALEIFVSSNSSGDAILQIEQHAYSSNVSSTTGEIVTITLTGVDATTLHLNNGIITSGTPTA